MSKPLTKKAFATTASCPKYRGLYGITVDELSRGKYTFVWTFPLDEKKAKREGFDKTSVSGSIELQTDYPGCPYCGNTDVVFCGRCDAISCYDGSGKFTCPKCGNSGKVEVGYKFDLKGGNY